MIRVSCYEKIEGDGPLCWYGEEEYLYKSKEKALMFIIGRLFDLGEQSIFNVFYDEDGKPTSQHLVTYSISCQVEKDKEGIIYDG